VKITEIAEEVRRQLPIDIRALISKQPMTVKELAEQLHHEPKTIAKALKALATQGWIVTGLPGDKYFLNDSVERGGHLILNSEDRGDGWTVVGYVTDNHLCNKHSRLDVLKDAYDFFAREGVTTVVNAGNWIEGEARFNRQELVVPPGMDPQIDYFVENYPDKKGITTHYVSGDDHEGWFSQRERINIGGYAQLRAEKAGRTDLKFLGHVEADVELKSPGGSAVARVMHPGGGSAYALSYAPQKLVESFQGGEKPAILFIGHYHKFDWCYPREVHCISGGCTCDQTAFLRKNKIGVHVGFSLVKFQQDKQDGHVTRVSVEWLPRYDRSFYEKRFE
jgi:hypothetical protein